jgi:hypothetical protein
MKCMEGGLVIVGRRGVRSGGRIRTIAAAAPLFIVAKPNKPAFFSLCVGLGSIVCPLLNSCEEAIYGDNEAIKIRANMAGR